MPRILIAVGLCLICASAALATPYAGEFMATGIGARPLGLGGAYVALVDDASAAYWNAAALPDQGRRGVVYMHSERFGELVNYDTGALVLRSREDASGARSAVGLGFLMVSIPNILFTTTDPAELFEIEQNAGDPTSPLRGNGRLDPGEHIDFAALNQYAEEVSDKQMAVYLSYGRTQAFVENLSVGGSVKFVRKSIDTYSAWGIGLDLAARCRMNEKWVIAANVQDLTTTFLDWKNTPTESREYITPTLKLGTAYTHPITAVNGAITVVCDLDLRFEDETGATFSLGSVPGDVRAGVEYWHRNTVAFRVGSERLGGDTEPFTVGAGVRVKGLSFDYAYRNHSDLDEIHRVSGGVVF